MISKVIRKSPFPEIERRRVGQKLAVHIAEQAVQRVQAYTVGILIHRIPDIVPTATIELLSICGAGSRSGLIGRDPLYAGPEFHSRRLPHLP